MPNDSNPTSPPPAATDDPPKAKTGFNKNFLRPRPSKPRAPQGRTLPPAPAWMQKPLRPPGSRSSG
jgi:hypothetical protein